MCDWLDIVKGAIKIHSLSVMPVSEAIHQPHCHPLSDVILHHCYIYNTFGVQIQFIDQIRLNRRKCPQSFC